MALGDMMSGNMGAEFSRALTVKAPKSKYGLIEGIAMGQKAQIAKAKRGVEADDKLNKLRMEAVKRVDPGKVDRKVIGRAQDAYLKLNQEIDQAVLDAGDAESAAPNANKAYAQFYGDMVGINAESTAIKSFRKAAEDKTNLVPQPIVDWLGNDKDEIENDGFQSLPGFKIEGSLVKSPSQGLVAAFPKSLDIGKYDVDKLKAEDVSYFEQNSETPIVETKDVLDTRYVTTTYKLKFDAVKSRVAALYDGLDDYASNVAYAYYKEKSKDPNFKTSIENLEAQGAQGVDKIREELINYRANQIYSAESNVTRKDEKQGSKRAATNVTVQNFPAEAIAENAPLPSPTASQSNINQLQPNGTVLSANYFSFGYPISSDPGDLNMKDSVIDINGNKKSEWVGSYKFNGAAIQIVPVYKQNRKTGVEGFAVQGKVIDSRSLLSEIADNNVSYEVFVPVSTDAELTGPNNKKNKSGQFLYPASEFYAQNSAFATKAAAQVNKSNRTAAAEMQAVAEMLNNNDAEAIQLYKQLFADQTNQSVSGRLTALAKSKKYTDKYMRGSDYKAPSEWGSDIGVNTPVSGAKKQSPPPKSTPPKAAPPKAAQQKSTAPKPVEQKGAPKEKPTGKSRRVATAGKVVE